MCTSYRVLSIQLLPHLFSRIKMEDILVILIVPNWPRRMRHLSILRLLADPLWAFPDRPELLSQSLVHHPASELMAAEGQRSIIVGHPCASNSLKVIFLAILPFQFWTPNLHGARLGNVILGSTQWGASYHFSSPVWTIIIKGANFSPGCSVSETAGLYVNMALCVLLPVTLRVLTLFVWLFRSHSGYSLIWSHLQGVFLLLLPLYCRSLT